MKRMGSTRARSAVRAGILRSAAVLAAGAAAWAGAGCAKAPPRPTTAPVADPMRPEGSFDLVRQAADAERQAAMLKPLVKELDEAPFAGQRPALRRTFSVLGEVLGTLAGPNRTGVFNHQYGVVTQVRDQLGSRPANLDDQPLVDAGLIATYNVLRDLSFTSFYQDEKLTAALGDLHKRVVTLQSTGGADHAILVTETVGLVEKSVTLMAGTMKDRAASLGTMPPAAAPASPGAPAAPAPVAPAATAPAAPTAPAPTEPPTTPPATTPPAVTPPAPTEPPAAPPATPPATPPAPTDPAAPPAAPAPAAPTAPTAPTDPSATPPVPTPPADPAAPAPPTPTPPPGEANK